MHEHDIALAQRRSLRGLRAHLDQRRALFITGSELGVRIPAQRLTGLDTATWRSLTVEQRTAVLDHLAPVGITPQELAERIYAHPATGPAVLAALAKVDQPDTLPAPTSSSPRATPRPPAAAAPAPAPAAPTVNPAPRSVVSCAGGCGELLPAGTSRPQLRYCESWRCQPRRRKHSARPKIKVKDAA